MIKSTQHWNDVVRWKGELLILGGKDGDKVLLVTSQHEKAMKLGIPSVNKGEYRLWVPKDEIEIVGKEEEYWKKGILL